MPIPIANVNDTSVPQKSNWSVGQLARRIISDTFSCVRQLVPMSPCTKRESQCHHCQTIGWSICSALRCCATRRAESRELRNSARGSNVERIPQKVRQDATVSMGTEYMMQRRM